MKTLMTLAAFLALAVPAALAVPPAGHGKGGDDDQGTNSSAGAAPSPSQQCKAQRRQMGMAAFRLLYAPGKSPKAAMDACLGKQSQSSSTNAKNAAKACKAERDADPQAFATNYGTNANKRNAFGKCVSKLASGKSSGS